MAGRDPGKIEISDCVDDFTLSVVIPTFNRAAMVPHAVDSVLAQRGKGALEVIVVDDGSIDGTTPALQARYGDNPRVRLIAIPHAGVSAARNAGLRLARGELVCFLDSDDQWTLDASATAMQVLALHPELVFVTLDGSYLPTHDSPRVPRAIRTNAPGWSHAGFARAPLASEQIRLRGSEQDTAMLRGDFFPAIVHGDLFQVNGVFMRRDAAVRAGFFNEWMDHYEDWDFFSRLCLQGPGAYLDYEGYQRNLGHPGRLAPGHPDTAMPRRHLYILHSLARRFPAAAGRYADNMRDALIDAQYQMGAVLARTPHRRRAWRYLLRCIRQRYKIGRSLTHLARSLVSRRGA